MKEAFNTTSTKVQSDTCRGDARDNNRKKQHIHTAAQYQRELSCNFGAIQRSHSAERGDTYRSDVSVGGTQALPSLWKTGASVYHLHHTDSCTIEQATCDMKDNTLIFTLKTRAATL